MSSSSPESPHLKTPFVGRASELQIISEALTIANGGQPTLVVIHGPAGIGKTALAAAVCAGAKGFRVVRAAGERSEIFLDFGVVDRFLSQLSSVRQLAADTPPMTSFTVGTNLLRVIGELQDEALLLVLDDAHWADESSLQAISFAFRRLQADRVALVVTLRDEETQSLPRTFLRLLDTSEVVQVALSGLTVIELKALAEGHRLKLSPRALDRLHAWTGGNPLHVTAMLSELGPEAILKDVDAPLPAPRSVADVVLSRLEGCSPEARQIIEAASILGVRCSLDQVFRLTDIEQPLGATDEAINRGLVKSAGVGAATELTFAHPLMAAAVYQSIPLARRSSLHKRAAIVADEEAVVLRHEVLARTGPDPDLADRLEAFAHRVAANTSWTVAAAALEQAARLSPEARPRERRLLDATDCWLNSGETRVNSVVDRVGRLPESARREYILARVSWMTGNSVAAEEGFHRAWEMLGQVPEPELAPRIAGWLGALYVNSGRASDAVEWSGRALAALPEGAAPTDHAMIGHLWGLAMLGKAATILSEVAHLPNDPRFAVPHQMEQLLGRGVAYLWSGNSLAARPDLEHGARLARERAALNLLIPALGFLADADYRLGEWDAAILNAELAASMADDTNHEYMSAQTHAIASFAQSARGQWDSAQAHIATAEAVSKQVGDFGSWSYTALARARLELLRENPAAAVAALSPILSTTAESVSNPAIQPWRLTLAEAYCRLGRLAEAEQCASQAEREIRDGNCRSERAMLGRVKADILAREGDAQSAADTCLAALEEADPASAPFEFAYLQLDSGGILRRLGRRRKAKELLESARQTLALLAAVPLLARCDAELTGTGLRPVHRTPDSRHLLTSQELAVARLVAEGLTNKQIASHLMISSRTVDYHLVHVFAKLGVGHRTQLARSFPSVVPATSPS